MFDPDQYRLIDFGEGRKLERFGSRIIDRECPAAVKISRRDPAAWKHATARFERLTDSAGWRMKGAWDDPWTITHGSLRMDLKLSASGQVGVFPEQAANWDWIAAQIAAASRPFKLLNLFAYTGGATLSAAAAGAEVTHVDAAENVVAWARQNAADSGLADAPIRWIVDDAAGFVRRELRRGRQYDAIVLDPPTYGHGKRGAAWHIDQHLDTFLEDCAKLLAGRYGLLVCSCHTTGFDATTLRGHVQRVLGGTGTIQADDLLLKTDCDRRLPSGCVARWMRNQA